MLINFMDIGIVSLYRNIKDIQKLDDAIKTLGYNTYVLDLAHSTKNKIYQIIKHSYIKHWIFSGSPYLVIDRISPQIPLELFKLTTKKYMFICYSLESVMYQLKYPISIRQELKRELFDLEVDDIKLKLTQTQHLFDNINFPMKVWRNHYGYLSSHLIQRENNHITKLVSYKGECMILLYKNSILIQYHPERTKDGIQLIDNWIKNTT